MEITALKSLFFVGTADETDAWMAQKGLKPRQVLESDKFFEVELAEGTTLPQRTVYYRETDSYFSPNFEELKECSTAKKNLGCGKLRKVREVKVYPIYPPLRRQSDTRYYKNNEVLCDACAGEKIVQLCSVNSVNGDDIQRTEFWGYKDDPKVMKVNTSVDTWFYTTAVPYQNNYLTYPNAFGANRENTPIQLANRIDHVDENGVVWKQNTASEYWMRSALTPVYHAGTRTPFWYPTEDVEAQIALGTLTRCSSCGKIYPTCQFDEEGRCPKCSAPIQIYGYHGWDGDIEFLHMPDEEVNENTMYFGFELETVGDRENKKYVAPYQHLFHLERDGSLPPESFEIISQPMTWKYLMAHREEISEMLKALDQAGQVSHQSDHCGLHVHVSRKAFKDEKAEKRAVAIVNALYEPMGVFARRANNSYATYSRVDHNLTRREVMNIPDSGHHVAVNRGNTESKKNTVEFRIFKGTLVPNTLFAAIEMCRNIVNLANSDKLIVSFRDCCDLDHSQFIPDYIHKQEREYGRRFNYDFNANFLGVEYPDWQDKIAQAIAANNPEVMSLFSSLVAGGVQ